MRILFLVFLLSACAHLADVVEAPKKPSQQATQPARQATHEQKHRPPKPQEQPKEQPAVSSPQGNPIEED